jgi:hypothetical protein
VLWKRAHIGFVCRDNCIVGVAASIPRFIAGIHIVIISLQGRHASNDGVSD